ncbi:hypothetical protein GCM10020295_46680 [Streptomyces cinereospinus]
MGLDFDKLLALLSIVIALTAFGWEFGVVGRKRLDCRVQMDTPASEAIHSPYAGVLRDLQQDGDRLDEPTFALLRIENAGRAQIETADYLVPDDDPSGIRVTFPRRRVVGLVVTELSQDELHDFFTAGVAGFGFDNPDQGRGGVVRLPKVKLPRRAHYQVLVVLDRRPGDSGGGPFPGPVFRGAPGGPRRRRTALTPAPRPGRDRTPPRGRPGSASTSSPAWPSPRRW